MDQDEVQELQAALDRSWELARQANDRPGFRAALEASVYEVSELPAFVREQMVEAHRDPAFQAWVVDQAVKLAASA